MHDTQKLAYERFNFTYALLMSRLIPFITDDTRKKAVDSRIIEVLIKVINFNMKDTKVCRLGCTIFKNLLTKGLISHMLCSRFD